MRLRPVLALTAGESSARVHHMDRAQPDHCGNVLVGTALTHPGHGLRRADLIIGEPAANRADQLGRILALHLRLRQWGH